MSDDRRDWVIWSSHDYWYTGKQGILFTLACGDVITLSDWEHSTHYRIAKRFTATEVALRMAGLKTTMSAGDYGRLKALDIRDLDADYETDALDKLDNLKH